MTALLVTGTGTGVGKTAVTAAVAALALVRGERVTVVKPAQTGEPDGGGGDLAEVQRLAGPVTSVELARYPDPLSPAAAARRSERPTLTPSQCAAAVTSADGDLVLVEGAGGLLVHYDDAGFTMADLAVELALPVVVVTTAGLGTLNATALTLEAMERRGLALHALVIGAWPRQPDLADRCNVPDLHRLAGRLDGALPEGMPAREDFAAAARSALGPVLGGTFDAGAFAASVAP